MNGKIHMITSTDTGKAFDRIQNPFVIKTLSVGGSLLNLIKAINEKLDITLNGEKLLFS